MYEGKESNCSRRIERINSCEKQIVLTFDCGFEHGKTSEILNILDKHSVKAVFFITGVWAERFPKSAKIIALKGHEIGNHTFEHPDCTKISHDEIKRSIEKAEKIIKKTTGDDPRPLFREPYGACNGNVLKAVYDSGYLYSIYWSIDTVDWRHPPADFIVKRVMDNLKDGDIVLMHVHGKNTAAAADIMIGRLKALNFEFRTIKELLK